MADVRARGYSLILRGLCALAMTGWIAVSDGLIDRNGKPLGTDFSNVYATGTLTLKRRPAEACEPALQHAAEKGAFGGREVPSRAGIIRRSFCRRPWWPHFPTPSALRSDSRQASRPISL